MLIGDLSVPGRIVKVTKNTAVFADNTGIPKTFRRHVDGSWRLRGDYQNPPKLLLIEDSSAH